MTERVSETVWEKLPDSDIPLDDDRIVELQSTSEILLDPETMNCGQCSRCRSWTTDREKPEPIRGLCNGATVNGELLCDDCLPREHKWAF